MKYVTTKTEPVETVLVTLEEEEGRVALKVGEYFVLSIMNNGEILLYGEVNPDITGLKVDSNGAVKVRQVCYYGEFSVED